MRILLLLIAHIIALTASAQQISDNDLKKLEDLQLSTQNLDLTDLRVQEGLNKILSLEKKEKQIKL